MRLTLLAFGKLKTPGLRLAADHYLRALGQWHALDEIELKALSVPDKSAATRRRIQAVEAGLLLDRIEARIGPGKRGALFLLDETGKSLPTSGWAENLRSWSDQGLADIVLCVGSSLGFAPELRGRARGCFSLGPQTLPHELARVVLLEQLFRAASVVAGHPYHNQD